MSLEKISDPVVAVAMENITTLVSGAHLQDVHLADSRDRATVIEGFDKLHRAGYELDPREIIDWALANNWRPEAAATLRDYAKRISEGEPPRMRGMISERLRPDIVEQWRHNAASRKA
jgi:hypothetical protein